VSKQNVEVVQSAFDAWNSGDIERVIEFCDPDVEFFPLRAQLDGTPYRGADGLRQFADDMLDEWEYLRIVPTEFRDFGDFVMLLGNFDARGRASGMDLHFPCAWVNRVRDGKLVLVRTFSNPEEAFEFVGAKD
jgi:uncharacterized protein